MHIWRLIGAILLVASIAIGAGMLALPIATGMAGFWPSLLVLFVSFLYMLYCLFLVLEANLVAPSGSHLIGMIKRTLGPWWQALAWLCYLLLLYSVVAAYITGGGGLLAHMVTQHVSRAWSISSGMAVFVGVTVVLVFCGTRFVDYCNRLLTLGLLVTFLALLAFVMPHAQPALLAHARPHVIWPAIPLILLSFTSHLIVPSLRVYLQGHRRQLVWVLVLGSVLPLLMYGVWEYTVLGILPVTGPHSLTQVFRSDDQVATMVMFFNMTLHRPGLSTIVAYFSFFALMTSFIGASLSLCHFIEDGLCLSRYRAGRGIALLLTFMPPVLFAWLFPQGFTVALGYAGVFVAILFCFMPALMVWKSRYIVAECRTFRCWGGRCMLVFVMGVAVLVMVIQILSAMLGMHLA